MSDVFAHDAITVTSAEVCDRGKVREENQDNVRSATIPLGELFVVADGIGGYQGGATASRMVIEGFFSQLASHLAVDPTDRAIIDACTYTNARIFATAGSSEPALHRMGSTVVLALVQLSTSDSKPVAWVGHVGDSRAYLIRNGTMQKITSDHSAVQSLLSRKLITEEEARNHPDASVLTRSLGHRPEVEIEIDRVDLEPGDGLLLCSDGLWGYVADADIAAVTTDTTLSVQTVAETLLHQALAAGGQDNIGIEFVRLSGVPTGQAVIAPVAEATGQVGTSRMPQLLGIGLLLLTGFGGLGYAAFTNNWWSIRGVQPRASNFDASHDSVARESSSAHRRPNPALPAPSMSSEPVQPSPTQHSSQKRIAVVVYPTSFGHEPLAPMQTNQWKRFSITRESNPACLSHAKEKAQIYAESDVNMTEALQAIPATKFPTNKVEQHLMTPEVLNDCGVYDAIIFPPASQLGAARAGGPTDVVTGTQGPPDQQESSPRQHSQPVTPPKPRS